MKRISQSAAAVLAGLLLGGGALLIGESPRSPATATNDAATRDKIVRYIRAKFGVPEGVVLTADPLQPASYPAFLQTTIISDNGKEKHPNNAYVTKDRRYLIMGNLYLVTANPQDEVVQHVREQFKIPAATSVVATPFRASPYPNLLTTTVTVDDGKRKATQNFYLTKDNRCLVVGNIFNLGVDPRREALQTLKTANEPSQGSVSAPVTIVEFGDLQCPMCARLHDFLESDLLPKYGNKVRIVYKEFPLASIHDWTLAASVACQCAYQLSPATYVPLRSMIFKNQTSINATNVRDLMLSYGEQAGLDRLQLAACIDSKASLPHVEKDFQEGQAVGVSSTPTCFVNGKMVVGFPSADAYYKMVDETLRAAK
ncbi:MAG: DsbA family protein [Acidobacteriia bacterium]|nr:DsbA family protein [Terriglobia bacterium]